MPTHRLPAFALIIPFAFLSAASPAAPLNEARPPAVAETDWQNLKGAIGITGPYAQVGELAPPGAGAGSSCYGQAIAVSGDRAVVGAPCENNNKGRAYVLERDAATGRWTQVDILESWETDNYGAEFGKTVAISGDTIVVGAPSQDVGAMTNQGKVYVFVRGASNWYLETSFTAAGNGSFGHRVAVSGNTVAVGTPWGNADYQGGVVIYQRSGSTWSIQASLTSPDSARLDNFGYDLALEGDRLLVGMPDPYSSTGFAYLFERSGGLWALRQRFEPWLGGSVGEEFGATVAMSGPYVAIGSPWAGGGRGAVQPFFLDSSLGWIPRVPLSPPDGDSNQRFGDALALTGNYLVVGAPYWDPADDDNHQRGAVDVFASMGNGNWSRDTTLSSPTGPYYTNIGRAVTIAGNDVLVGVPGESLDFSSRGQVRVLRRSGTAWSQQVPLQAIDDLSDARFGNAVAISGNTAVVSAPRQPSPYAPGEGAVNVYVRGPLAGEWRRQTTLPHPYDSFSTAGSVAIDGNTIVVGVPTMDLGTNRDQGAAFVYVRTGDHWDLQTTLFDATGRTGDNFGRSVAISGNTVVVGVSGADGQQGSVWVYTRSGSAWSPSQRLHASDGAIYTYFGWSTAISGNTIVVGASACKDTAYIFGRSTDGWTELTKLQAPDAVPGECAHFGGSVAVSGSTVIIGAPHKQYTVREQGAAYIFAGSGSSWTLQASLKGRNPIEIARFGHSVALSGQTAVVGMPGQNQVYLYGREGTSWYWRGSGLDTDRDNYTAFGHSVAISGTLVLAGAPAHGTYSSWYAGRAFILADDALFANGFEIE